MKDKVVFITGATAGIGKETARALAKEGARLIISGRNPQKGAAVLEELKSSTGNDQIELMISDLEDLSSVRKMAADFKAKHDKLDVLINNAGYLASERVLTKDGHEKMFGINYLAPFLLTHELLDLLKKSDQGRIVNVSSNAMLNTIDLDNLNSENKFSQMGSYGHTKSLLTSHTNELARRLEGTNVTANSLHPGVVYTNMIKSFTGPAFMRFLIKLIGPLFFLTPEKGAATTIYAASSPDLKGSSGKYLVKKKITAPKPVTEDQDIAKKLWAATEKILNLS